jgi:hypothetical protein
MAQQAEGFAKKKQFRSKGGRFDIPRAGERDRHHHVVAVADFS